MPTNQQRREAAQRKLERQLIRRQEQERQRRQRLIVVGVVATVLVIGGAVWFATTRGGNSSTTASDVGATGTAATSAAAPKTPCTYTAAGKAAKAVKPPTNTSPANTGTIDATITLSGQAVGVTLDRAAAPCTVNSFVSLASQGFYDSSPCWRLTANSPLSILQCGDPSGVGNGGPGYTFADELTKTKTYPKGTLAMANSGADTNGSQFFVVYATSTLSPQYTVFGKVSDAGMAVVDAIAAKGVKNNAQDGPPNDKATIESVKVPDDAVNATGTYATASSGAGAASGEAAPTGAAASGAVATSGPAATSGAAASSAAPTAK